MFYIKKLNINIETYNDIDLSQEQITTFKLSEYFEGNNISESQKDQYRKMLSNGKMPIGPWQTLQTDEKLQEVETNEGI